MTRVWCEPQHVIAAAPEVRTITHSLTLVPGFQTINSSDTRTLTLTLMLTLSLTLTLTLMLILSPTLTLSCSLSLSCPLSLSRFHHNNSY